MGKLQQIQDFIASEPIALAGVSRDPKKFGFAAFRELKEKGIKHIWIQKNAETGKEISELEGSGINLITNECILMFYKPDGVHKFHVALKKIFRRYPR